MDKETIDLLAFIKGSKHRINILLYLGENIKITSQIAENVDLRLTHTSRTLKELKEKDLVIILNPEAKRSRLYRLTDRAKDLLKYLP
ncbi:MAG: winged helix DNA-binding protein [Firmicutes bacterium]|nr:winged helix DNA-binding protein [Bacillota bacterium]